MLIPANVSPFKQQNPDMASGADRLAMCRLAAETLPFCTVDGCELERAGVSYTVDTVRLFRNRYPEAELVLLVGSDMFLSFPKWHCWQEILEMAALGVVSRMDGDMAELEAQRAFLLQYAKFFCVLLRFARYLLQKFAGIEKIMQIFLAIYRKK